MKKILLVCLLLFSIALSYGGSLTPEPAENDAIENVLSVDLNILAPVAVSDIYLNSSFKLLVPSVGQSKNIYNVKKQSAKRRYIYRNLSLFYNINLTYKNFNSYSLILNNTSGGLSK